MPKVSILVPCYNVEKYIRQCMDSIVNQTLKDIEIICINDGSKDKTLSILQEYASKDNRVKIIDKANSGYGHSMNKGLELATGEYIGIVESDDFAELDMFEVLYNTAKKHNVDVVKSNFYGYLTKDNSNNIINIIPKEDANKVFCPIDSQEIFLSMPCIWAAIYRKDFLKQNNIKFLETPGASYQDTGFNCKVFSSAKKVYLLEDAFLHYRQDNEHSSVKSTGKVFCVCDEWHEIERYLKDHKIYEKLKYLLPKIKYGTYCWNFNRLAFPLNWQFLQIFYNEFKELEKSKLLVDKLLKNKNLQLLLKCKFLFYISRYIKFKYIRRFIFRFQIKNKKFLFQIMGLQITNYEKKKPYLLSWRI